jgi:hypothetical protein
LIVPYLVCCLELKEDILEVELYLSVKVAMVCANLREVIDDRFDHIDKTYHLHE